jgi:oxygen-independent coproporphyrinogen-3 oxidase
LTPGPAAEGAPIGVYIHWPYCSRICPYCDFNVVRDRGRIEEQAALVEAIAADLAATAALTGRRRLVSVYFGGGTPSLMEPAWIARLVGEARSRWTSADDLEVTLEANPSDLARFAAFADAGVTRLSLGVQALDDAALKFLGRNHDAAAARAAVGAAARAFPRLSLDLIYALPGQTEADWRRALADAADLGAEHISPYQLTIEPEVPFGRAVRRGLFKPADEDEAAALYEATGEALEALGFTAYEVSNHARGDAAKSRHNLVYWRGEDYAGVGPGAHGRLTVGGGRLATATERGIGDYIARVAETGRGWASSEALDARLAAEERLILGMRTDEGVPFGEVAALGLAAGSAKVRELVAEGFLADRADRLIATKHGRLLLDRLVSALAI